MTLDFSPGRISPANASVQPALAIIELPALVIESANNLFLSLISKSSTEVIGKTATEVFSTPEFAKLLNDIKVKEIADFPFLQICNSDNQTIDLNVSVLRDKNGAANKISIVASLVSDITAGGPSEENKILRQENDELKKHLGHLMEIIGVSADVVYKMSADWKHLLELDSTDFVAATVKPDKEWMKRYVVPTDRPMVLAAIKQAIDQKQLFELQHRVIKANGEEGWILSRAVPVLDGAGNILEWLGLAMDITGKKKTEEKLLKATDEAEVQRRMYEAITGNTPDLIYVFNLDASFAYANDALLTMWGRTKEDSIGKSLLEIGYEPWHAAMHEKEIKHIKKTHETVRGEVAFPHATLGKRIYDYILVPVLNAQGEITAVAGTTRDITEIKKLSAQKDEFLAIASHELKTPLTSVKAYGQVLQEIFQRKNDTAAVILLQRMDNQVNKLTGLVNDLLDVTRINSGKIQFNEEKFDLGALAQEILDSLQFTTQKHVIQRELAKDVLFFGDRERVGQVITNLVTNAIKYSPAGGKVKVHLVEKKDKLLLTVKDSGLGIPKEMQTRVFEQFYRAGNHKNTIGGMGIGLYISSEIVNRSGGKIWVESIEGIGSTFFVSLPKTKSSV